MTAILQSSIPFDVSQHRLPGVGPFEMADWLWQDEAFGAQMALRDELVAQQPGDVLALHEDGYAPAEELLCFVLAWLGAHGEGYRVGAQEVQRPDGIVVPVETNAPLRTLARLVQEDLCLMIKPEGAAEHVLAGAALCFPANWRLAEKIGRPLLAIHAPVAEYDAKLAARVQRLFDGVQVGRPLWRFNALSYSDPALHQPYKRVEETAPEKAKGGFFRSERQCILRLPETRACVFSIHTFMVKAGQERHQASDTSRSRE